MNDKTETPEQFLERTRYYSVYAWGAVPDAYHHIRALLSKVENLEKQIKTLTEKTQ